MKKMGRPPAAWANKVLELPSPQPSIDLYELVDYLGLKLGAVKMFLQRLDVPVQHRIVNGRSRAQYQVADLKIAVQNYLKAWEG